MRTHFDPSMSIIILMSTPSESKTLPDRGRGAFVFAWSALNQPQINALFNTIARRWNHAAFRIFMETTLPVRPSTLKTL
jgi:hypothetical protein